MGKGYKQKLELYREAYTHPSATKLTGKNYQRLELLGDRILNMVVMEMLYHAYPNENEGMLSQRMANLTSGVTCAKIARSLELHTQTIASSHALATSDNTLSDVIEAFIGAIYLNDGFEQARAFVVKHWTPILHEGLAKDAKTELQEFLQARKMASPIYYLKEKTGPDHKPTFAIDVVVGMSISSGKGSSRKEAEHDAASKILVILKRHEQMHDVMQR